jgi:hypothetical protein
MDTDRDKLIKPPSMICVVAVGRLTVKKQPQKIILPIK